MTVKGDLSGSGLWTSAAAELNYQWAMRTDLGHRREINEDSAVAAAPVFAVADGMGGHEAGEVASACVVERLAELGDTTVTEDDLTRALRDAVNDLVASGVDAGSGTTVTGIALQSEGDEPILEVFNIGDSRVYLFRDDLLVQVTRDHSIVQELVDAGQISADEAEVHPHANVITRAVGFHDDPVPEMVRLAVQAGDRVLICSDGLTKELTHYGLAHFLAREFTIDQAADELINAALSNGGRDNVTLIVLQFDAHE